jgi:DnaA family protein
LPRDMATLCDALDKLDQASLVTQRRLTVPFVRSALGGIDP